MDAEPALEVCDSCDAHQNCPEPHQLSYRLLLVNQIGVVSWFSVQTPPLPLILRRMPKEALQKCPNQALKPTLFITAAAMEIGEQNIWKQTATDTSALLWEANEPV